MNKNFDVSSICSLLFALAITIPIKAIYFSVNEWKEKGKKEVKNGMISANDAFWEKLKLAVENKVGAVEAQRFCKNFFQIHRKLVYEELSLDVAYSFINSSKISTE